MSYKQVIPALFPLGMLYLTQGIQSVIGQQPEIIGLLARHALCDWGDICDEDKDLNRKALTEGTRIFSAYDWPQVYDGKIWIITEADRSATTILLPSEY